MTEKWFRRVNRILNVFSNTCQKTGLQDTVIPGKPGAVKHKEHIVLCTTEMFSEIFSQ